MPSGIGESDLKSVPVSAVKRFPETFGYADQIPENLESVVVYRWLGADGSHIGIIEPGV